MITDDDIAKQMFASVKNANKEAERKEKCIYRAINALMQNEDGRMFLVSLIESSGVFSGFSKVSDFGALAYEAGQRDFGNVIIKQIEKADKNNLPILLKKGE